MSETARQPIYHTIDSENEIRLLEFLPSANGEISLKFHTALVEDNPQYTALSYVWGDKNVTQDIKVNDTAVPVTLNLFSALPYVRQHWQNEFPDRSPESFRLWVDAICINQSDIREKNHQVQRMCSIFGSAELVLGWLGSHDPRISLALETFRALETTFIDLGIAPSKYRNLRDLIWIKKHPQLTAVEEHSIYTTGNKVWAALDFFCKIDYWGRVWILQEVVIAARFLYISASVSATRQAVHLVGTAISGVCGELRYKHLPRPDFIPPQIWAHLIPPPGYLPPLYSLHRIASCQLAYERRDVEGKRSRYLSDLWVIRAIERLKASEPKDHIYAILGISSVDIVPDYGLETQVADVFVQFTASCLKTSMQGRLNFLSQAGTALFKNELQLPSWTPNYVELSRGARPYRFPGEATSNSWDWPCPEPKVSGRILSVWGVKMQKIARLVSLRCLPQTIDATVISFLENFRRRYPTYVTGMPALQAIYQTMILSVATDVGYYDFMRVLAFVGELVGKRDSDIRVSLQKLGLGSEDKDIPSIIMQNLFSQEPFPSEKIDRIIRETRINKGGSKFSQELSRAQRQLLAQFGNSAGLQLIETEEGYLGLVPEKALVGDIICLIRGWKRLALLRKSQENFILVSSAFVTGLMNREAGELLEKGELLAEPLNLV